MQRDIRTFGPVPTTADCRPVAASLFGLVALFVLFVATPVRSQDEASKDAAAETEEEEVVDPRPLLEREPYDQITLDEANENAVLKVVPISFPGRKVPPNPDPRSKLTIQLLNEEGKDYEVFWRNILRLELFEQLLLKEAQRLTAAGNFDEAFEYYYRLRSEYPDLEGLDLSVNRFLYLEAVQLTRAGKNAEALGLIEELMARDASFKYSANSPSLIDFLGGLLDRLASESIQQGKFAVARTILSRISTKYGDNKPKSIDKWIAQLAEMAAKKRDEAKTLLDARKYQEAIRVAKQMTEIWPSVEGGPELDAEISRQYPLVVVGVVQPALTFDAQRIDNWASRRTGRLVHRSLVEFLGAGPEGGQYQFALGLIERSDDQRGITLRLNQLVEGETTTGYEVSRRLLKMADPSAVEYNPAWGGLVASTAVKNVNQVDVRLRRAHVLPEALLRVPLQAPSLPSSSVQAEKDSETPDSEKTAAEQAAAEGDGPFKVGSHSIDETQFLSKTFRPGARLAEIIERRYANSQEAMAALRRGDIDIIDRLFPADALRIRSNLSLDSPIVIEPYALPTVHMLLVNQENLFLKNRDFRRALLFAIDRQDILGGELLGGSEVTGCRVLSGPFPAGAGERDLLAYAYDTSVPTRKSNPRLAKLLTIVATNQVVEMAEKRNEEKPELGTLVLGHPAHEAARVACQAMAAQWKVIGIECQLEEFPPGATQDPDASVDLTYAEIAIWEPVIDARRLLGHEGLAASDNPYVGQALRWLDQAQNWGEARDRLVEIHRIAHNEVVVLPLWQTVDFFAYHKRIRNIGENPVWLYQNIEQWRVGETVTAE